MARLDDSRPFIAVNIAVLTVSDTRTVANDTSGDTLAARIASGKSVLPRVVRVVGTTQQPRVGPEAEPPDQACLAVSV